MLLNFILIGLGMVLGDVFMKSWSNQNFSLHGWPIFLYIFALCSYIASLTFYGLQLRVNNFSIATTLPIIINVLVVAILTVVYYKEPLSLKAGIGILLAITSIIFLYQA